MPSVAFFRLTARSVLCVCMERNSLPIVPGTDNSHNRRRRTGGGLETEVRQRRATSKPQWFRRPAPLEPTRHFPMADFDARPVLMTETASVWDVACRGACKHRSDEEYVAATHLVFTYRGVYVHHVGRAETVAEANQAVILNENEPYRVSHPFEGGDACLSIATSTAILLELAPEHYLLTKDRAAFNRSRLRVDTHTQALAARLRHGLRRGF